MTTPVPSITTTDTKASSRAAVSPRTRTAFARAIAIAFAAAFLAMAGPQSFAQKPTEESAPEASQPKERPLRPPGEDADRDPEQTQPGRPGTPTPEPGVVPPQPRQSEQEKAEEILERIGETLREVEQLMVEMSFDAESTGAGQTQVVEEIDKLLGEAGRQQQAVLDGIDELIEMARRQQQQQQQGGSGSQQQQQSQSDSQKPQDSQQQQQQQQNGQEKKDAGQPENSEEGQGTPNKPQRPGDPAPEEHWSKDVAGRWGALPPKLQELIRQGDPAKFPPQYREMLEEYYKRLSDQDK